jgi:hypothetical protein
VYIFESLEKLTNIDLKHVKYIYIFTKTKNFERIWIRFDNHFHDKESTIDLYIKYDIENNIVRKLRKGHVVRDEASSNNSLQKITLYTIVLGTACAIAGLIYKK